MHISNCWRRSKPERHSEIFSFSRTYLNMKCEHFLVVVAFFSFSLESADLWRSWLSTEVTTRSILIFITCEIHPALMVPSRVTGRRSAECGRKRGRKKSRQKSGGVRSDGRRRESGWHWNWSSVTEPRLDISLFCLCRAPTATWPGLDLNNLRPSDAWNIPYIPWRPFLFLFNFFLAFLLPCSLALWLFGSLWGTYALRAWC